MNSLTVNLHLLMVSFFRPSGKRKKILIEYNAFPSDRYAAASQLRFHGLDPAENLLELKPDAGSEIVSDEVIQRTIEENGDEIALILIGGVNYYTGQLYPLDRIVEWGHEKGCKVGFDLAHGAGNIQLKLHDSGADFACWCSYKYLNSGPGSLSGIFVHERHGSDVTLPRFEGWWGHDKNSRFAMPNEFVPIPGAEGWQLSNPPILPMAAMRASLEIFHEVGMKTLCEKSEMLSAYLIHLVQSLENDALKIITPLESHRRGCQVSLQVQNADKYLFNRITEMGVISDWREPDVIRVAPVPLYNSFADVYQFVNILSEELNG